MRENLGFFHFMRDNFFILCANLSCKLLILLTGHFHFMRELTCFVTGSISLPLEA